VPDLIILAHAERMRFKAYCEQEARTYAGLARQMENTAVPAIRSFNERKAVAYQVVAYDITPPERLDGGG